MGLRSISSAPTTDATTAATVAALASTLGVAAACWVVAVEQMDGMDMGVASELGSFAFFVGLWVAMMAAMMLPGAAPAALRRARVDGRVYAAPLFVGPYLAVWVLVGVVVYAFYAPHGTAAAGIVRSRRASMRSRHSSGGSVDAATRVPALVSSSD
jgi:predicted metal-binding membrane protein